MFKKYRINRLKEMVFSLEEYEKELDNIVHSGAEIPIYYVDKLLSTKKTRAALQKRLELLEAK